MRRRWTWLAGAASLACASFAANVAAQDEAKAKEEGEGGPPGRMLLQVRPRFSSVEQSNKPLKASAANMRLLFGYRTAPIGNFGFTGELVDVSWRTPMHATNVPGDFASRYPLVGDPNKTDVNLLFADFTGLPETRVRVGRQAIKLDNERFVGDADVRQMPQVFDALSVRNTSLPNTELFAAQAWHLRTYFGNRFQTRTTLLNARTEFDFGASLGGYAYLQDQPQVNAATGFSDNSNKIFGLRLEGNLEAPAGVRWYYTAETAEQHPYAGGDALIRAGYRRLALGPSWNNLSAQLNHERLGSNQGRYGFQMPLSYNTFQGWAYQFFATPPEGVRDLSVSVTASFGKTTVWLKQHQFKQDFGGRKYGEELDFAIDYRFTDSISMRGVFTHFRRDAQSTRPSADRHYVTLKYEY